MKGRAIEILEKHKTSNNGTVKTSQAIEAMLEYGKWVKSPKVVRKDVTSNSYAEKVISAACKVFDIAKDQLLSKSRKPDFTMPRFICFKILSDKKYTRKQVGKIFNRDHSTIVNGLHVFKDMSIYPDFVDKYNEVKNLITQKQ